MGLLLQSCLSPNATLSFVPVSLSSSGNTSNSNTFFISGNSTISVGSCHSYVLNSESANGTAFFPTTFVSISVGSSTGGAFYSDSSCATPMATVSLPAQASSVTVYFKASASGTVFLQAWAQNYSLSSLTVTATSASVGVPSKLAFSTQPSATVLSAATFSTQPTAAIQDSGGNAVSTAFDSVSFAAYQDATCSVPAAGSLSISNESESPGMSTTIGLSYALANPSISEYIYLKASFTGLTSACSNLITVSPVPRVISSVATAMYTACALSTAGNVYCWGKNDEGEMGNGTTNTSGIPTLVSDVGGSGYLNNVSAIAGGGYQFCAIRGASQNVYCWGAGNSGQLGDGAFNNSTTPVEVLVNGAVALSGVISVSVGFNSACAVTLAGYVYCWGGADGGQLGNGQETTSSSVPVGVLSTTGTGSLSGISTVSVGIDDACAVSVTGTVYCWGSNNFDQLGTNGVSPSVGVPILVNTLSNITSISVNFSSACAVSGTGNVYCWGNGGNGQIGDGSNTFVPLPIEVLNTSANPSLTGISTVSVSSSGFACASSSSQNTDYCWGLNSFGYLGNGTETPTNYPSEVSVTGTMGPIQAGEDFACSVVSSHVYCWGENDLGELGQATTGGPFSDTPIEVTGPFGSDVL